ncbi:restriction endonuclease [Ralstonia solanacearum]|uniref:winged helix-turn-helix domain-containing protein n=1 Tax=Ralstonia solanacearum TaxID=305 RepID=UPI0005ABE15C|nr:restriction endonuclease [Ralstonia solanacearum]AMP74856.1 restriction endonuclease [Ralstonia solanacearum]
MSIPDYQTLMLPVLRVVADGEEHRFRDVVETLAAEYELSDEDRAMLLPSGTGPVFDNRVGWARTYLKQAGVVESKRRGYFSITDRGRALLAKNPSRIDNSMLDQYPEFATFRQRKATDGSTSGENTQSNLQLGSSAEATPEESFAQAYERLRVNLEAELLTQVKASTASFFERLVIDLLVAMGYGGSRADAGQVLGRSGDGGIDGTIKEDKLGLDVIYVQAKKWEDTVVGRPEIQKFAGALQGQRAHKGVFITTATFSREAREYVGLISTKVILIDGALLSKLMVDHNVGVSTISTFAVKKIDSDYFDGDGL